MQAKRVVCPGVLVSLILTLAAAVSFASGVRAAERMDCTAWLSTADVETALEMKVEPAEPVEYSPDFTVCSWMKDRPEGQLGVHFSFFGPKAMREGAISAESIPEYFDLQVASKRGESGAEPEKLDGVGKRAVLFTEEWLWIVMIELEEGFGHLSISPTDVGRAKLEALAKAVRKREKK
jgi:hypothetical protein